MAELRAVECVGCGHKWNSGAKPKNLKCKKCKSTDILDAPMLRVESTESIDLAAESKKPVETVDPDSQGDAPPEETEDEETTQDEKPEEETPEVELFPKQITCPRCKGDGIWHTTKTGHRLETNAGPVVDESKPCPECKGTREVTIMVTAEELEEE